MMDEMAEAQTTEQAARPRVLKVTEGLRGQNRSTRIFSVVLSGPVLNNDLAVVAEAADPKTGLKIPAPGSLFPGSEVPGSPDLVARPPFIHPVGLRAKGGALIAPRSNFYNVRVSYVPRTVIP